MVGCAGQVEIVALGTQEAQVDCLLKSGHQFSNSSLCSLYFVIGTSDRANMNPYQSLPGEFPVSWKWFPFGTSLTCM